MSELQRSPSTGDRQPPWDGQPSLPRFPQMQLDVIRWKQCVHSQASPALWLAPPGPGPPARTSGCKGSFRNLHSLAIHAPK